MAWQEFQEEGGLLWNVFLSADEEGARGVKDLLKLLNLPNPEEGQYFSGNNVNRIYSNPHGLSISVLHKNVSPIQWMKSKVFGAAPSLVAPVFEGRKIAHPNIIKPLLQVDVSKNCSVEIVGGLPRASITEKDLSAMRKNFSQDKIDFYFRNLEFVGELSAPDGEKHKILTNRRAVRPMKSYNMASQGNFGLQDKIYQSLSEGFAEAFNSASGMKMSFVLNECAHIAALPVTDPAKILHAHWNDRGHETERRMNIVRVARNYEPRIHQV